jgi:hypothetical protein
MKGKQTKQPEQAADAGERLLGPAADETWLPHLNIIS